MIDNLKISILIPLYNAEKYIAETIESCLHQTYDDIEIIIVDDGSTDASLTIARGYENRFDNIKVYVQKNSGASAARNKAFSLSTGMYIQYLDADDLLHPDKIRLQMEVLKNTDERTVVFGTWGTFHKNIDSVVWKYPPVNKNYDDSKQFLIDLWGSGMTVVIYAWLFPRGLVKESGGWDESLSTNDDGEFSARVVSSAKKILFVERSIGYYRKDNTNSLSKQISREALESNLRSFETYLEIMKENFDQPEIRECLAWVYSRFLYRIPPKYTDIIWITKTKIKNLGFNSPFNTLKTFDHFLSFFIGTYRVNRLKKTIKAIIGYKEDW